MFSRAVQAAIGAGDGSRCFLPLLSDLAVAKGVGSPTFTRASTQYVTDFEGILRPVMAGCAAFEGSRVVTNLCLQSQTFGTTWALIRIIISSGADIAPDGSATAHKLITDTSNNSHYIYGEVGGCAVGATYTISFYAKKADLDFVTLYLTGTSAPLANAYFNLVTGTVAVALTGGIYSIIAVGNGWYRCEATITTTDSIIGVFICAAVVSTSNIFVGDGIKGFYLWGTQLENVTGQSVQTAGEYIPTTSAPVTKCFTTTLAGVPIPDATLKGYLSEPAGTNLCLQSQTFSSASWSKVGTCTISGTTQINTPAISDYVFQTVAVTLGATYTYSVIVSGVAGSTINISTGGGDGEHTVTLTTIPTRHSFPMITTSSTLQLYIIKRSGNTANYVVCDGAQLELGSVATSYIPTTTTTVTRAAAVLSIPTAGNIQVAPSSLQFTVTLDAVEPLNTRYLFSTQFDASNGLYITMDQFTVILTKKVTGVPSACVAPFSAVAGIPFTVRADILSDNTLGLTINETISVKNSNTDVCVLGTNMYFGSNVSGINQIIGSVQ